MVVVHAYPDHAHHTIPSTSRERAKPAARVVGSAGDLRDRERRRDREELG
jgi:hypothetical protein